eukprot:1588677-Alexandrium_andersonii.AAC.1
MIPAPSPFALLAFQPPRICTVPSESARQRLLEAAWGCLQLLVAPASLGRRPVGPSPRRPSTASSS